jgi:hypothetical protein
MSQALMPSNAPPWTYRGGRKPGVKNKLTRARLDLAQWARSIIADPDYQKRVKAQAILGTLSDTEMKLLYEYGFGKPDSKLILELHKEDVEQQEKASPEEAASVIERTRQLALEAAELEGDTVDAEVVTPPPPPPPPREEER